MNVRAERGRRKLREGTVVSDKMHKTIVVAVDRQVQHAKYKKFIRARTTYKVHDEKNDCHTGDRVSIVQSRPISKRKRWRVREVVERAK